MTSLLSSPTASTMNIQLAADTPKFDRPPVIETVLGVQFKPLARLSVADIGRFQIELESRGFSTVQQQQRLEHVIEQKGARASFWTAQIMLAPLADMPRIWFLSEPTAEGQQLVQLQNDRLIQNWRRKSVDQDTYPSYSSNRAEFGQTLEVFRKFVESRQLGSLVADQCELVYVNQIPFASAKDAFQQCFGISLSTLTLNNAGSDMERMQFSAAYWCDAVSGRVHIEANSASIIGTTGNTIDLRITARGAPTGSDSNEILDWMDAGHHLVVNTFKDITSETMHQKWGQLG
jgi:uncharacterized protein (TIGR04255 family)